MLGFLQCNTTSCCGLPLSRPQGRESGIRGGGRGRKRGENGVPLPLSSSGDLRWREGGFRWSADAGHLKAEVKILNEGNDYTLYVDTVNY